MKKIKVCNGYAGIGGNRKFWDKEHLGVDLEITAIELDPNIAKIYQDFFPKDKVIVTDAHQYILEHFAEFDFIWSSPPCPTHSIIRAIAGVGRGQNKPVYPDMRLYQEIILLDNFFKGYYCIENVISYYQPLIQPRQLARHYFWTNLHIPDFPMKKRDKDNMDSLKAFTGFDVEDKLLLRNCVQPTLGLHIFNCMLDSKKTLFD